MIIQLSAGQGPLECQLAVGKLFVALQKEFPDIELLSAKTGSRRNCYDSIQFQSKSDLSMLEGSIQWICQSPFRPEHKRKNWFVDISIIPKKEEISGEQDFRIEKFHSGGNGGQHVNKVETGIRITHIPTGITVTSTEERSQYMNKQKAFKRIQKLLSDKEKTAQKKQTNLAWQEHNNIIPDNPVRVYEGMQFKPKKK